MARKLSIGALNRRVELLKPQYVKNDESASEEVERYDAVHRPWGRYTPGGGSEGVDGAALSSESTGLWELRDNSQTAQVKRDWRIQWRDQVFDVESVGPHEQIGFIRVEVKLHSGSQ